MLYLSGRGNNIGPGSFFLGRGAVQQSFVLRQNIVRNSLISSLSQYQIFTMKLLFKNRTNDVRFC